MRKIGTVKEIYAIKEELPPSLLVPLVTDLAVLDYCYGPTRNWMESGGYAVILEAEADLKAFQKIVDYTTHPCEYAKHVAKDASFLYVLYLMNDDYSLVAYIPVAIAPNEILKDLED